MLESTTREGALFSASLAAHASGVTWADMTSGAAYVEEIDTRVGLAIGEHATWAEKQVLKIVTPSDAERVLFYLDQFEALGGVE